MSLKDRLYYKAKQFIEKIELEKTLATINASSSFDKSDANLDFLNIIATIKAYDIKFDTLIDVGSHKGKWAQTCDQVFNFSKIICVEPNPNFEKETQQLLGDKLTFISKIATDKINSEGTFYLHDDSTMSSMVPSDKKILSDYFPYDDGEKITQINKEQTTLDAECKDIINSNANILLKIDTQGNELDVLKGSAEILTNNVKACLVEHMFLSPYQMNYTFEDVLVYMKSFGFRFAGCVNTTKRSNFVVCDGDFLFIK